MGQNIEAVPRNTIWAEEKTEAAANFLKENQGNTHEPEQIEPVRVERGLGRPKLISTGNRDRPNKEYRLMVQNINHDAGQNFDEHQPEPAKSMQEEDSLDELENPGEKYAQISEISVKEALTTPDAEDWKEKIACELKSILKNKTWILKKKPTNKNVV